MLKEYTCIICPNGCEISVEMQGEEIIKLEGSLCDRGDKYIKQEIINPQRNIASSVLLENGVLPLASVRLTNPIPKSIIFNVMEEIKKTRLKAPVYVGQVAIQNILNLDSDVIVTKNIASKK